MDSFDNIMDSFDNFKDIPLVDNLKNSFNSNNQNYLEIIIKIVSIVRLVAQKGIFIDDLQNHNKLFCKLCVDSNLSITDDNIDNIVNQIIIVKNDCVKDVC